MRQNTIDPVLARLDAFIGHWTMQASVGSRPMGRAGVDFQWLEGRRDFVIQHVVGEHTETPLPPEWLANSPLPLTTLYGLDETTGDFTMLYADGRGVHRSYRMTLHDRTWRIWREAPNFWQRFEGTFSEDGNTISGYWEGSPDGSAWQRDFDLRYERQP